MYDANQAKALKMFYQGSWRYVPYASGFRFLDIESTEGGKILQVNGYGMGIGTADTKGYKLAVAGNMIAESVKVQAQGNWPDYVFSENYIKERGHLPGTSSAGSKSQRN